MGSLLLLRRWHILLRAGVSSVHTWRTSAPRLVSSVLHTPLWATRSDASVPSSEGLGRGFDGSGTGSPTTLLIGHIRSGIRLYTCQRGQTAYEFDLTALRQSSGLGARISRAFELGGTSYVGTFWGLGGVRCIEVWGQTGTGVALGLSRRQPSHKPFHIEYSTANRIRQR